MPPPPGATPASTLLLILWSAVVGAVVLASLAAATQWTAALLAYHPALGTPWLDLLGLKLYAPGQVFSWWLAFVASAAVHGNWRLRARWVG